MANATDINRAYYGRLTAGRANYWKLMPAPRMRIRKVVEAIGAGKPNARQICDFGCGNGDLLAVLAEHFSAARLCGIDLSDEQVRQNSLTYPDAQWATEDLTSGDYLFPFGAGCDVAVSSEVIEHLDHPAAYLSNIHASLEPGGLLVLTTQSGPVHATERIVGHVRHWAAHEMTTVLATAGFCDIRIANCGFPFHDLSKWAANLRPGLTISRFGESEWGAAERTTAAVLRLLFRFNSARRGYQLIACARR